MLGLSLPFADGDPRALSLPRQSLRVSDEVKARMLLHSGEVLAALPSGNSSAQLAAPAQLGRFGSIENIHTVAYDFLTLMSISTAKSVIEHILAPTSQSLEVLSSLSTGSIPAIELTLFGSLLYDDIVSTSSALSAGTPSSLL